MKVIVDQSQNVNDKGFISKMEEDLEKLYVDGKQIGIRNRRSLRGEPFLNDPGQLSDADDIYAGRIRRATSLDPSVDVKVSLLACS